MRIAKLPAGAGLMAGLFLAGCGGGAPDAASNAATPDPDNAGQAAPSTPLGNAAISFEADKVEFRYSWPAAAARIPELDAWLRGNGERLRKETQEGARRDQEAAKRGDYAFTGYSYTEDWHVAADLPALLVMESEGYSFTGGAHGMPIVTALFWDKAGRQRLATSALFDVPALIAAIRDRFCKALDAERARRRGEPVDPGDPGPIPGFVECVDPAKQTILPASKGGEALDTVRIVIMPYEAGPYAEGIYEIDLPVDESVLRAVKPAWRSSFSTG